MRNLIHDFGVILVLIAVGCSNSDGGGSMEAGGSGATDGGTGGSAAQTAGTNSGGTTESGGTAGSATDAGTSGDTAGGSGGTAETDAGVGGTGGVSGAGGATGGTGGASGGAGGMGADNFPTADCAPGAIFCDDFEQYLIQPAFNGNVLRDFIKMGETTPTWLGYHFHGPPYVVAANVFGGAQVYQLDTEDGHPVAADIIKESADGVDLWPAAHYGRVMVNLKGLPTVGTAGIITESGLLPGSTTNTAQYTIGSSNGKLSISYAQRVRPFKNDVSTPTMRIGGNWENASEMPTTLCTVTATTETIAANNWVCVEWSVDRTTSEVHLWLDGVPQTEVDVTGGAGATCSIGAAATWQGPEHFTELDLGWEINGNDAGGRGAQYDMFAIGRERLHCPTQ